MYKIIKSKLFRIKELKVNRKSGGENYVPVGYPVGGLRWFHVPAICFLMIFLFPLPANTQSIPVAEGWAANSVNTVIFRKNSIASFMGYQFIAFYNEQGYVVLGKRKIGDKNWEIKSTPYKGNVKDAHNNISIILDGEGYIHLAWNQHNNQLNYAKSREPLSLVPGEKLAMTGQDEDNVTYPEFYNMPDGNILFLYRDGRSGKGNLVMNRYILKSKKWERLHTDLIDGEGQRNAYWQAFADANGTFHISWVWRESQDVATNHDMCYARSTDGGVTWEKSTGEKYILPITASTAEYARKIPQKSELINQTSMVADDRGNPYIATYWRDNNSAIPQYRLIYRQKGKWKQQNLAFRKTPFSLSGGGTKRIPISRPQIVVKKGIFKTKAAIIFRDEERGNKVSIALNKNIKKDRWHVSDLSETDVGSWEPSFDTDLWRNKHRLHLFVQKTDQTDGEGLSSLPPQMIYVLQTTL